MTWGGIGGLSTKEVTEKLKIGQREGADVNEKNGEAEGGGGEGSE